MASKLVIKNCKLGDILCDQNEICRNLYIIKNGQISLCRLIKKESIDTSNYPISLLKQMSKVPDTVEIEVKLKYNPGDLLLVTEILTGDPSKYRVRIKIPSQVYMCTVFDIVRYIGMEKFRKIPDADFFEVNDADLFRYHVESQIWDQYRESVVGEELNAIQNKIYFCNSKNRTQHGSVKHFRVNPTLTEYFKSKQEFFAPPDGIMAKLRAKKRSTASLHDCHEDEKIEELSLVRQEPSSLMRLSYSKLRTTTPSRAYPHTINEVKDSEDDNIEADEPKPKRILHNMYTNNLDDDHLAAIYKYQFKKIVSAAYRDHKPVYHKELTTKDFSHTVINVLPANTSKISISRFESPRRGKTLLDQESKRAALKAPFKGITTTGFKSQKEFPYINSLHKKVMSTGAVSKVAFASPSKK